MCAHAAHAPVAQAFLHLVAIADWTNLYVLAWRPSNTLDTSCCLAKRRETLAKGKPESRSNNQGKGSTRTTVTDVVCDSRIAIIEDRHGRSIYKVSVPQSWRTLKLEAIYLCGRVDWIVARRAIGNWLASYDHGRLHIFTALRMKPLPAYRSRKAFWAVRKTGLVR